MIRVAPSLPNAVQFGASQRKSSSPTALNCDMVQFAGRRSNDHGPLKTLLDAFSPYMFPALLAAVLGGALLAGKGCDGVNPFKAAGDAQTGAQTGQKDTKKP